MFVRHHDALDYERMGWVFVPALEDTHHGRWSVLMEWICECKCPTLKGERL